MLTLEQMRQVHAERGTVSHNGVYYPPGSRLPTLATLAVESQDPAQELAARVVLLEQLESLKAQLALLGASAEGEDVKPAKTPKK